MNYSLGHIYIRYIFNYYCLFTLMLFTLINIYLRWKNYTRGECTRVFNFQIVHIYTILLFSIKYPITNIPYRNNKLVKTVNFFFFFKL